jgi:hypothetical protein
VVLTPPERAAIFLHEQVEWVSTFAEHHARHGTEERDGRINGTLNGLLAAGVVTSSEAQEWRQRLGDGKVPRPVAPAGHCATADALLAEALEAVPEDDDGIGAELVRFEGALGALVAVGAVDGRAWDERLRALIGWPSEEEEEARHRELNSGGTLQELLAVYAGPPSGVEGTHVIYILAFADGVSVLVHRVREPVLGDDDDWWDIELADDLGTRYGGGGGGGSDREQQRDFDTPIPPDATWLELREAGRSPIRIALR